MVEKLLTTTTAETEASNSNNVSHVKSLRTFQQYVQMPQVPGIVFEVFNLLNRRIGVNSLDIESVAGELNVSKRTLQRHLRRNGSSFMELRDKVRFRHAMECLLEKQMTIESIASYLHFSDRTSFTNAFKHWSGYSPSHFRKLYRPHC